MKTNKITLPIAIILGAILMVAIIIIETSQAYATSGACSYHGGVNCSAGMQPNGNVYCNDGWTDSIVQYDFMAMCQSNDSNPEDAIIQEYMKEKRLFGAHYEYPILNQDKQNALHNQCMSTLYQNLTSIGRLNACVDWVLQQDTIISSTPICPAHSTIQNFPISKMNYCLCDDGYYDYDPANPVAIGIGSGTCVKGNPPFRLDLFMEGIDQSNTAGWSPDFCPLRPGNPGCVEEKVPHLLNQQQQPQATLPASTTSANSIVPEGAVIRAQDDIDVYIVKYVGNKMFKRLILSPAVFKNYGHLHWENVLVVSRAVLNSFTTSDLVRAVGDSAIYRLYPQGDTGIKRLVRNQQVFNSLGLDSDAIYEINAFDRDSYITGLPLQ